MLSILPLVLLVQSPTADFVSTAEFLRTHGFPSPKGGTYCQATYKQGSIWGYETNIQGPGWALPARKGEPRRFLNTYGTVCDLVKVEKPRNLADDLAATFKPNWIVPNRSSILIRVNGQKTEESAIPADETFLITAYLSGKTKEAVAAFERRASGQDLNGGFIRIMRPILSRMWDRSITAHMAGDDRFAANSLKWLVDNRAAIEEEGKRGLKEEWERMSRRGQDSFFSFLKPAPVLYADSLRRLAKPRKTLDFKTLKGMSVDKQVRLLIENLEDVKARQFSQPGGVSYHGEPTIKALVDIGGPSIEPLLKVIAEDTRLTRSVSFGRDFFPDRNLIPVSRVARVTYDQIIQVFNLPAGATPEELRAFWKKYEHLTPTERQFEILKDDTAGRQWADAARYLMTPNTHIQIGLGGSIQPPVKPGEKVVLRAESLRDRHSPSLTEVFSERAVKIAHSGAGFEMIQHLAQWEPAAVVPIGHKVFKAFATYSRENESSAPPHLLARFVRTMVRQGDQEILKSYADWIAGMKPFDPSYEKALLFYPVVEHMEEPAFSGLVTKMFGQNGGRINLAKLHEEMPGWNHVELFLATPLLRHPEFRAIAIDLLKNKKVIGETQVHKNDVVTVVATNRTGHDVTNFKDLDQYVGTKTSYRLCDTLALTLTREDPNGMRPYWPEEKRDAAISELVKKLANGTYEAPKTWYGDYGVDPL